MNSSTELEARISRYKSFLKQDPSNLNLAMDLLKLLEDSKQYEAMLDGIANLTEELQKNLAIQQKKAETLLIKREFSVAENYLKQLFISAPTLAGDIALRHMSGLSNFFQENYEAAKSDFQFVADAAPSHPQNWKYFAYSSHHLNQLSEAKQAAQHWVELAPDADSYGYLAVVLFDLYEQDAAREFALKAVSLEEGHSDANTILGSLALKENDLPLAETAFRRSVESNENSGRAWLGQGLLEMVKLQLPQAKVHLERAHQLMPLHIGTLISLGWVHFKMQEFALAKSAFEQAVNLDHNFAESYGALACALVELEKVDDAKANMLIADKLDKTNFSSAYAKVLILKHEGKEQESAALLNKIISQAPRNSSSQLSEHLQKFATDKNHA